MVPLQDEFCIGSAHFQLRAGTKCLISLWIELPMLCMEVAACKILPRPVFSGEEVILSKVVSKVGRCVQSFHCR